ncbi:MAG: ABC transporter ATP-binding protein [bacterium]
MKMSITSANLTKVYTEGSNKVTAVSSVNLQLYEGEVIGLFGPSGSGKTTLLSMLGCILRPTEGSLQIYGTDITCLKESELSQIRRRYLSFIFQGFNLFPALTAFENVLLVIHLKGMKGAQADARAQGLLSDVGLSERMHFLPRDLSGGQKQRVSVARALAADSPIILADEPTANLDFANGRRIMEILKKIATEQKKCVVVATHDGRLDTLFERILIMEDGKIVEDKRRHHEK